MYSVGLVLTSPLQLFPAVKVCMCIVAGGVTGRVEVLPTYSTNYGSGTL